MYGILFSNELQKMAWGIPKFNVNSGMRSAANAINKTTAPEEMAAYRSFNVNPATGNAFKYQGNAGGGSRNTGRNPALEQYMADYKVQNAGPIDASQVQLPSIKPPKPFSPPSFNELAQGRSDGGSGGFSAMRGASPQR